MAWSCVLLLKNSINEFLFSTFPISSYTGPNGQNFTTIRIGGYRESNSEAGTSANYREAEALENYLLLQPASMLTGKFSLAAGDYDYASKDFFVYGKAGGTGIRCRIAVTNNDAKTYDISTWRYLSFSNYNTLLSSSSSYTANNNKAERNFIAWCMLMNEDTEEMYLGYAMCSKSWYYAVGDPHYYDRCTCLLYVNDYPASSSNLWSIFHDSIPSGGDDPYEAEDYVDPVGGHGPQDDTTEVVDTSPIPVAAATRSGFITAFVPTWGEIKSVASALLDPNIFQILGSSVVKLSDVVIGLSAFPCTIPATQLATVTANFLGINIGTGVQCHVADDQYLEIDCGSLTINEYWCNCLDYNPYTTISIFLPFCGMYELDADEVMGKTINVTYRIDIFSGACLATIKINGSVFYQYTGQCSSQIPVNSVSFDNFLSSMIDLGIATATGVTAIKGAGGEVAKAEKNFAEAKNSEVKGALEDMLAAKDKYNKVKEDSGASILGASVNSVTGGKGFYSHAGAMGGSPGFLAVRKPFIIIKRPEQVLPSTYGKFHGYPTNTTAVLGDLAGYTEVSDIRLNIPNATVDEIIECEQLLKGGVVI